MQLSNDEIRRYSRHLILPEVGLSGQKKICSASVLCIYPSGRGWIVRSGGQASVFPPHLGGPRYRRLYPDRARPAMVRSCAEGGRLGLLPAIIGRIQATGIADRPLRTRSSLPGGL